MASLGAYLRELRTTRGTSLDEVARATRVASRYLEALEADNHSALPAPAFTRGFVRAYCQLLGVAPDEALALYDQRDGAVPPAVSPRPAARATGTAASSPGIAADGEPRSRGAVLVSFVLLVVLGLALFAVTLMIQPAREERADHRGAGPPEELRAAEPESAPAAPVAPATPAPGPPPAGSAPPGAPEPSSAATAAAPPPAAMAATGAFTSPYRLVVRAVEPTWIRVRTDDGRSSEETLPPGEVREWVSNRPFVLTIGNAGGINVELNGRALPSLGARGAVISRLVLPPEAR